MFYFFFNSRVFKKIDLCWLHHSKGPFPLPTGEVCAVLLGWATLNLEELNTQRQVRGGDPHGYAKRVIFQPGFLGGLSVNLKELNTQRQVNLETPRISQGWGHQGQTFPCQWFDGHWEETRRRRWTHQITVNVAKAHSPGQSPSPPSLTTTGGGSETQTTCWIKAPTMVWLT